MEYKWLSKDKSIAQAMENIALKIFGSDYSVGWLLEVAQNGGINYVWNGKQMVDRDYALITVDGKEAGIIGYYSFEPEIYWLGWFGVLPEYRRRHIGIGALKNLEEVIKKKGAKYLYLYTGKTHNKEAVKFYQNSGFYMQDKEFLHNNDQCIIFGKSFGVPYKLWEGEPVW